MPYLVASDCRRSAAGQRFRALIVRAAASCRLPGARERPWRRLQVKEAGVRSPLSVGRGDDGVHGPAADLGVITVDEVAFFIRQVARASRSAAPGRRRHRLRRGAQRHAHGARVRGCRRGGRPYRRSAAAQEMRPSQRQEAGRCPGHGRRRSPPPRRARRASCHYRAHRCGGQRRVWKGPWRAPSLYLEAGADAIFPEALTQRRDVPRLRPCRVPRGAAAAPI